MLKASRISHGPSAVCVCRFRLKYIYVYRWWCGYSPRWKWHGRFRSDQAKYMQAYCPPNCGYPCMCILYYLRHNEPLQHCRLDTTKSATMVGWERMIRRFVTALINWEWNWHRRLFSSSSLQISIQRTNHCPVCMKTPWINPCNCEISTVNGCKLLKSYPACSCTC